MFHAFITGEEQGFGLVVFFLGEQIGAQPAAGVEGDPIVGYLFFADFEALASEGL